MKKTNQLNLLIIFVLICYSIIVVSTGCQQKFIVQYTADEGGEIVGLNEQIVTAGCDTKEVVAIAKEGYKFLEWSDGLKTANRTEYNIKTDITVRAIFKKEIYSIRYIAYGGGTIEGQLNQQREYGQDAESVIAIPDKGYYFVGWSDGLTEYERQDKNIISDLNINAYFRIIEEFVVEFVADEGGSIIGESKQIIRRGQNSSMVTAVENDGYEFVGWSDGIKDSIRQIYNVCFNHKLVAKFKRIKQTYDYIYNGATENCQKDNITINRDDLEDTNLEIPIREGYVFSGWYLDWHLTTIVCNSKGELQIGEEIFDNESCHLYAKWNKANPYQYNILLINISKVDAKLKLPDGNYIHVKYNQTPIEKRIQEQIALYLKNYLNATLNGDVYFNVVLYNTTIPITEKEMFFTGSNLYDYEIMGDDIPETREMCDFYDSVITSLNLNDYYNELHHDAGSTYKKNACIHVESIFDMYITNGYDYEYVLDNKRKDYEKHWENHIAIYLHEFIHTIELQKQGLFDYHKVLEEYVKQNNGIQNELETAKLYLTNQFIIDGKNVGIPNSFWINKFKENKI